MAIESSDRIGTLATLSVASGQASLNCQVRLPADKRSAQSLVPEIQRLLADAAWQPKQIELIAVATGPGSFTGLRIGVTAAKSFAYATGAKLVGVHTLAALAAGVESSPSRLWTILDAQRQELFVACFESGWRDKPADLPDTRILGVDHWRDQLRPGDTVCGPPLSKLGGSLPDGVAVADESVWTPQAEQVGRLGIIAMQQGLEVDAMQLVPSYYRKSAAEEKADRAPQ